MNPNTGRGKAAGESVTDRRGRIVNLILLVLLVLCFVISFCTGKYALTLHDTLAVIRHHLFGGPAGYPSSAETVFLQVRMPRLLSCILVGAALSSAGAAYQGIFRNPMVSPDLLGASSGSAFGACCGILLGMSYFSMHIVAFLFGLAAVALTFAVSSVVSRRENTAMTLILTGMVVSSLFSAGISITKLLANPDRELGEITFWLMGSMTKLNLKSLPILIIPVLVGLVPMLLIRYRLNLLSLGEEEARTLGVNVAALRLVFIVCSTLVTSASVAACGMVGWIGLVIPHLIRMLIGPDYRHLLPASVTAGALFLLMVDNITRVFFQVEVSIGILTALVGAPFFLFLLMHGKKGWV